MNITCVYVRLLYVEPCFHLSCIQTPFMNFLLNQTQWIIWSLLASSHKPKLLLLLFISFDNGFHHHYEIKNSFVGIFLSRSVCVPLDSVSLCLFPFMAQKKKKRNLHYKGNLTRQFCIFYIASKASKGRKELKGVDVHLFGSWTINRIFMQRHSAHTV